MAYWLASLASNHRLSPLWVRVPQVAMLRTCPNLTLAVEWDVKRPQLCQDASVTLSNSKVMSGSFVACVPL